MTDGFGKILNQKEGQPNNKGWRKKEAGFCFAFMQMSIGDILLNPLNLYGFKNYIYFKNNHFYVQ